MEYIGINKKLLNRRLELDFSIREACMKLDISRTYLFLIEQGYVKVKNEKLRAKFIHKYMLEEDFFTKDNLEYPTPIEEEEQEIKITKFSRFIASWKFRLVSLILMLGFICMGVCGLTMYPRLTKDTQSFFSKEFNDVKEFVRNDASCSSYSFENSSITSVVTTSYHSYERKISIDPLNGKFGFFYTSLNFIDNDEYLPYTFYKGYSVSKVSFLETEYGWLAHEYETRNFEDKIRVQYYTYFYDLETKEIINNNSIAHISADYDKKTKNFKYNIVEAADLLSISTNLVHVNNDSFEYSFFTSLLEDNYDDYNEALKEMFNAGKNELKLTYEEFDQQLAKGIKGFNSYSKLVESLSLWGLLLGVIFLAFLVFSYIKAGINAFREKVLKEDIEAEKENPDVIIKPFKKQKHLSRNSWPMPIIPEYIIRILVLIISAASSLGLYFIFQSIQGGDPIGLIQNIQFKTEISSFATIAVMILFFTKLDILQSQKNTFKINYILFFLGLIFYGLLLMIQFGLSNSNTILSNISSQLLVFLPGNIIWGILAFNLLSTILFSNPKFQGNSKTKLFFYRSLIIIPIGYMFVSCLYQVGSKAWGWSWPFAVTSLLFSKGIILTAFAILYCLAIYLYKRYTEKRYGNEAILYQHGNRYLFIKNFIVCCIVAILGVLDLLLGQKLGPNNAFGFGGHYVILYVIPFILLYHPHFGQRSIKWDLIFSGLYALSMVIGLLLIASNISSYIAYM